MIPDEIKEFFGMTGGHSLIIKGEPGSGKTTLALEILNEFRKSKEIMYLSTRVHDQVLIKHFPWVENVIVEKREETQRVSRRNLNILEGMIEEGFAKDLVKIEGDEAILEVGELLPEMERIYDFSEENFGRAMVAVDSIDGLSEKYGIPPEKILYAIQKDLIETGAADVIFVMEETSTKGIDYLGDGIVMLRHEPYGGFWNRVMEIRKLRGAEIRKPRYMYTLHGGRFRTIRYEPFSLDITRPDFSSLRGFLGRFRDAPVLNIAVDDDFPRELVQLALLATIYVSPGNVLVLPPVFYPGDVLERHCEMRDRVKVIGFGNERRDIFLEGQDMIVELSNDVVKYHGGEKPTVVLSVEVLENIYGSLKDLPSLIKNLKLVARVVLITPEGVKVAGADREIRMETVSDVPVVRDEMAYGIARRGDTIELVPLL